MKYLSLLLILGLVSCSGQYEKPFVITYKSYFEGDKNFSHYQYHDNVGKVDIFEDSSGKYNIGDTLK